jgi:transcriptional regulator with GAF, ATPase, and Fis domain
MSRAQSISRSDKASYDKELISTLLDFTAEYRVDHILKLVVNRIPKLVGAREASLFWLDRELNRIVLRETYYENRHNIGKRYYKVGEGLTGWVAKTGRSLRIKNIENERELKRIDPNLKWTDKYEGFRNASRSEKLCQRAYLAVPIKIDGITMGVLRIAKTEKPNKQFSHHDEKFISVIADNLAAILKKADAFERVQHFEDLIERVFFRNPETMHAYLIWAVNLIPTILNCAGCTVFLKDDSSGAYVLKYASKGNPLENKIGLIGYYKGEGLTGWVLQKGRSLLINDIEDKEELRRVAPDLKWMGKYKEFLTHHSNYLAAPIKTAKEVYGVIRLAKDAESTPFSKDDERLLCRYANYLAASLETLQHEQTGTVLVKPMWKGWYPIDEKCCYVLMPYSAKWSENVKHTIRLAVESQNLCFRIAAEDMGRMIIQDIWKGIWEARIVIADLSAGNPNVSYEVGLADVIGKQVILLAQDPRSVPFDFAGARLLIYSADRLDELQDTLAKRIAQILDSSTQK